MIAVVILIDGAQMAHAFTTDQTRSIVTTFWILVSVGGSVTVGKLLRNLIQRPSSKPYRPKLDFYKTAYLAAGHSRAVESAIAKLVHEGYLHLNLPNRTLSIAKILPPGAHELEQQLMRRVERYPALKELRVIDHDVTEFLKHSLQQEKLLMKGWAAFLGNSFWYVGLMLGMGFFLIAYNSHLALPVLCTLIVSLCVFAPNLRTRWGCRILDEIHITHDPFDIMQRFALFGYQKLSGGVLDDLRQAFTAEDQEAEAAGGCGC